MLVISNIFNDWALRLLRIQVTEIPEKTFACRFLPFKKPV